jgi:hypothetical protein
MSDFACFAIAVAVFGAAALYAHAHGELFRSPEMQPPLHRPRRHLRRPPSPPRIAAS